MRHRFFITASFLILAAPCNAATSGAASATILSPGTVNVAATVTEKQALQPRRITTSRGFDGFSPSEKTEYFPNEIEICIRPTSEVGVVKIAKQAILKRAGERSVNVKIRENVQPPGDAACSKTLSIQISGGGKTLILLPIERHFP